MLSDGLIHNSCLKTLDISHNSLGLLSGLNISRLIQSDSGLEELDFAWNEVKADGPASLFKALQENSTIKKLKLSRNGITDESMNNLGAYLSNNDTMTDLNLNENHITSEGAKALADGLGRNGTLKYLVLSNNPISPKGAYYIVASILQNKSSQLSLLDIKGVNIDHCPRLALMKMRNMKNGLKFEAEKHVHPAEFFLPEATMSSMDILDRYIQDQKIRVLDIVRKKDRRYVHAISRKEFTDGMLKLGFPLQETQLRELFPIIDADCSGFITYREIVKALRKERQRLQSATKEPTKVEQLPCVTPLHQCEAEVDIFLDTTKAARLATDADGRLNPRCTILTRSPVTYTKKGGNHLYKEGGGNHLYKEGGGNHLHKEGG